MKSSFNLKNINTTINTIINSSQNKLYKNSIKNFSLVINNKKNKSHNNNLLFSYQKKSMFNLFKHRANSFESLFVNASDDIKKNKKEEWFVTEDTIVFQAGKYNLLKVPKSEIRFVNIFEYGVVTPLWLTTGYYFIKSLITLAPLKVILFGGLWGLASRILYGTRINKQFFVYHVNLLEDGKHCEIGTVSGIMKVDISTIRRLTGEEAIYLAQVMPDAHLSYIPLVIDKHFFLIYKISIVNDKQLFSAVTNGKYIKVKEENKINKEDAIDIDITNNNK